MDNSLKGAKETHIVERLEPIIVKKRQSYKYFSSSPIANDEILAVDFVDHRR